MEDMLYDSASMKRFVGISIDEVPDETTLCKFRHFWKPQVTECLFSLSRSYLEEQGLLLREGTIVDASIIEAPSSTKIERVSEIARCARLKKAINALWDEVTHWDGHWGWCSYGSGDRCIGT